MEYLSLAHAYFKYEISEIKPLTQNILRKCFESSQ